MDIGPRKFWRVNRIETQGVPQPSCASLEFRAFPNGPDQCAGGTAITTSNWPSYPASAAFDHNDDSFAVSPNYGEVPHYIGYEFPAPVNVAEIRFARRYDSYGVGEAPKTFQVQGSDDGINWITAWAVLNEPSWESDRARIYTSDAEAAAPEGRRRRFCVLPG